MREATQDGAFPLTKAGLKDAFVAKMGRQCKKVYDEVFSTERDFVSG